MLLLLLLPLRDDDDDDSDDDGCVRRELDADEAAAACCDTAGRNCSVGELGCDGMMGAGRTRSLPDLFCAMKV